MAPNGQKIYSTDIVISYDPQILKFKSAVTTDLSKDFSLFSNDVNGTLRLGIFGVNPINSDGEYLRVQFEVAGKTGADCDINLDRFQINNGPIYVSNVSVTVNSEAETPNVYSLKQNFPNPFNSETVISYELANKQPQRTTIVIYNLLGKVIKTLVDKVESGGSYRVIWDGTNDMGVQVPSCVYLYIIQSGSFQSLNKMVKLN